MERKIWFVVCGVILVNFGLWNTVAGADNNSVVFMYPLESKQFDNRPCKTSDGADGVCKSDCPREQFNVTSPDICFFNRNDPVYCCTIPREATTENLIVTPATFIVATTATTTMADPAQYVSMRPREADLACNRHRPYTIIKEKTDQLDDLIKDIFTGGIKAISEEHPYMTAIGWTRSPGVIDWNCGGIVISEQFVLTAAHCASSSGKPPDIVRVGDINLLLTNDTRTPPQDYTIRQIYIHPDYNTTGFYHDIALFEINDQFSYSSPACIWPRTNLIGDQLLGMGYGTREYAGPKSNVLYQGNLTIVPNEECNRRVRSQDLPDGIIDGQLCAHDPGQQLDTCQGDSGGPLIFFFGDAPNVRPHVVAITSFGTYCAGSHPSVYTRVATYLDWIEGIVWPKKTV